MRSERFRIIVRVSAALCVASAVLWGWSVRHPQSLRWAARSRVVLQLPPPGNLTTSAFFRERYPDGSRAYDVDHRRGIEWANGHVWLIAERVWEAPSLDRGSARPEGSRIEIVSITDWYPASDDTSWRRLGLGAWRQTRSPQDLSDDSAYSARGIAAPCWFLVAITLLAPVGALMDRLVGRFTRRRGQRRQSTGLCRRCGYDLRATPDRCPECGTPGDMAEPIGRGAA